MDFNDYLKAVMTKTKMIDENTSEMGETSVFSGNNAMGPHHHNYIIWDLVTGYGYTGDVIIDNPEHKQGLAPVCDHIHLIRNFEMLPLGDGHTHTFEKPLQVAPDTVIGGLPIYRHLLNNETPNQK